MTYIKYLRMWSTISQHALVVVSDVDSDYKNVTIDQIWLETTNQGTEQIVAPSLGVTACQSLSSILSRDSHVIVM